MSVVGLITEYNPFHNGHLHHINEAKRLTGANYVVVVMSGDFVQRGAPALIDKYTRTRMALSCGADLVIELPVCYATASAEYFALGAVATLNALGFVDSICFGSEVGDLQILSDIASLLIDEPKEFKQTISEYIKSGDNFPTARTKAIIEQFHNQKCFTNINYSVDSLSSVLSSSNNILGIEYLKALKKLRSRMRPYTIPRIVAGYHDTTIVSNICSATAIRRSLQKDNNILKIKEQIPLAVYEIWSNMPLEYTSIGEDYFSSLLYYKLLEESFEGYSRYLDVSEDLSDRIISKLSNYTSFSEFATLCKSKQLTQTRINRALLHILLSIKKKDISWYLSEGIISYIRILGMKKEASHLIRKSKLDLSVPIITKTADAKKRLSPCGIHMLEKDFFAAHLYDCIVREHASQNNQTNLEKQTIPYKESSPYHNEYTRGIVIL